MKTIVIAVEFSVEDDVDPDEVANALFEFLVDYDFDDEGDLGVIFSVDGAEPRRF